MCFSRLPRAIFFPARVLHSRKIRNGRARTTRRWRPINWECSPTKADSRWSASMGRWSHCIPRRTVTTRMAAAYTTMLNNWKANGGGLFTVFADIYSPSNFGEWGALESFLDPVTPLSSAPPKWQALQNFISGNDCWWANCAGAIGSARNGNAHGTEQLGSQMTFNAPMTHVSTCLIGVFTSSLLYIFARSKRRSTKLDKGCKRKF